MSDSTQGSGTSADWRKIHAFGLPAGSVRALLALLILAAIWVLLVQHPDRQVPIYLQNLMFIILGHYFAARGAPDPADEHGPPPLFLPRGVIRFSLLAGFLFVAVMLFREDRLFDVQPASAAMTLVLVAGFLLGVVLSRGLAWWRKRGHRPPRRIEDVRALVSLAAAVFLVSVVFDAGFVSEDGPLAGLHERLGNFKIADGLAALIGFYFGSRS